MLVIIKKEHNLDLEIKSFMIHVIGFLKKAKIEDWQDIFLDGQIEKL